MQGGDVADLCLTFSATTSAFGETKVRSRPVSHALHQGVRRGTSVRRVAGLLRSSITREAEQVVSHDPVYFVGRFSETRVVDVLTS